MRRLFNIFIFAIFVVYAASLENVNAIQCFECSSEAEIDCVTLRYNENQKLPVKSCADDVKSCFIEIQGAKIIRGCMPNQQANNLLDAWTEHNSSTLLKTCSTQMCNNDEIPTEFCITCEDSNCKTTITPEMRTKCPFKPQLMGCYHFEENNQVKRGCMSEIEDEDFRNTCQSNNDNCKNCLGKYCNSRKNGFQKCLVSNSSNLQETDASTLNSKICTNYKDQCYTLVANNTIRRGCLTDESNIDSMCQNEKNCEKCSNNNCNSIQIAIELCVICDSKVNRNCRRDPSDLMWDQCPFESIRPLGCFMYETNKHVQRGCMSAQNENFRNTCDSQTNTCKTCVGNLCNRKPHFTRCRICRSDKDGEEENCVRWPWKAERKICQQYYAECFTHVSENGTISRGCFDEFDEFELDKTNCDDDSDNNNTCLRCSDGEDGCNDKAIKLEACILCDSETDKYCKTNATYSNSEICPRKTINPLGCFHFINQLNGHTKRGCVSNLSDENQKYAIGHANEWKFCVERENCNTKDGFIRCLSCNSSNGDSNCISNPSRSNIKVCDKYEDVCFTFIDGSVVSRNCLGDLESELIEKCRSSPGKCETCTNDGDIICNNEVFSENTCIVCDSDKDYRCRNQPELLEHKLCNLINSPSEDFGCFLDFDELQNRVQRGCITDLNAQHRQICLSNSDKCKVCKGTDCNKKIEFQKCFSCTSLDNSNCVQNAPYDVAITCKNYMDKCLMAIDRNGFLVRQCASDWHITSFNESELCDDNVCNGKIFPENRIQCFQCDGDESCSQLRTNNEIPLESKPCTLFNRHDQCFMYLDRDHKIHRGCLTDPTDSRLLCERNNETCVICDENGCNGRLYLKESALACHQCKDNTWCGYGQVKNDTIKKCSKPVKFGTEESCFTRALEDGSVERGCTLDDANENPDWCRNMKGCVQCEGYGCNDENIYFSNCLRCDSMNDKNCEKLSVDSSEFQVTCVSTLPALGNNSVATFHFEPYAYEKRGCYMNYKDGILRRGCIRDLTDEEQKDCDPSKGCHICEHDYCNDQEHKSAANQMFLSSILVLFIVMRTAFYV